MKHSSSTERTLKVETVKLETLTSQTLPLPFLLLVDANTKVAIQKQKNQA